VCERLIRNASGLARGVSILYTAVSSKGSCSVVRALYHQAAALVRKTRRLSTLILLIRINNDVELRWHACTLTKHSVKRLLKQWALPRSARREGYLTRSKLGAFA